MYLTRTQKREEIQKRLTQLEEIKNAAVNEKRHLTDDEKDIFKTLMDEIESFEAEILLEDRQEVIEKRMAKSQDDPHRPEPDDDDPAKRSLPGLPARPEDRFQTFGEQLQAIARANSPDRVVDRRLQVRATGMNEGVPSEGGFLVQTDFAAGLRQRVYETGQVISKTTRVPISGTSNGLKVNAIDETSRATGSRWGGIRAYWLAEGGSKTKSKPKFRQIELSLEKLIGLCYATDELLQDAAALETIVSQGFAEEFGFQLDDGCIRGSGAGQPLGILNSGCLVTVAKETGQLASTIVVENIVKMWARCWAKSRMKANWFINQTIEPQLFTMGITVGTGGAPIYMPAGGLSGSPYSTLMGRPVIAIEQAEALGTLGDIILGDFGEYIIIDKGGMQSAESIHVNFTYDETTFRFVYRVDGQPIWNAALTPYKGGAGNTLSPFVVLASR